MTQMNLFDQRAADPVKKDEDADLSIDERFARFATGNPHVLTAALQIAQDWLANGRSYISVKAIYENLRVRTKHESVTREKDVPFKLNNDFTAPLARWLIAQDSRLEGVLRLRERKSK